MRLYLVLLETRLPVRAVEVLHSTKDGAEALEKLEACSDQWEQSITEGKLRVFMTTFIEE